MNRRTALQLALLSGLATAQSSLAFTTAAQRKFTIDLCPGRIGVATGQQETIDLAAEFKFESVEPMVGYLESLDAGQLHELESKLEDHGLVWGAAGLPVDFRKDGATFNDELKALPKAAATLRRAGVDRVGTWLMPGHEELTYLANFKQHARRLRNIAKVLGDYGVRFGLEYVGPRTSWSSKRYPFVHSMAETKELIAEIGLSNVGFVLDSWHWYTAEEDVAALKSLSNDNVVAVDLNDAPAGVAVEAQIDNRRELPAATGVIDVKAFLTALVEIGYDGPIRAEPFNQALNKLDNRPAVELTGKMMHKAVATLR